MITAITLAQRLPVRIPVRVMILLALLLAVVTAVIAIAAAHSGVPVHGHLAMYYDGKPSMYYD